MKNMKDVHMFKCLKLLSIFLLLSFSLIHTKKKLSFEENWLLMQNEYKTMSYYYNRSDCNKFCHNGWIRNKAQIKRFIEGKTNKRFLNHSVLSSTMVRGSFGVAQKFEETYLEKCLSDEIKLKIGKFKDINTSWLPHKSKKFNCSVNTLGHLYYTAKIFEKLGTNTIKRVVEFGGGYGNLARIFKSIDNDLTIFLIDLPEFLSLQALFLRESLPQEEIIVHTEHPEEYKKNAIHLIPIYLLENLDLDVDLFVSNFALSETKRNMQSLIYSKNFFNADFCYISGQLDGWGKSGYESQEFIFKYLRNSFSLVEIDPFHIFLEGYKSYEVWASK